MLLLLAPAAIASSTKSATHDAAALTTATDAASQCAAIPSALGAATHSPAESAATDATAVAGESTHVPLALCTARCNGVRLWHDGHRRAVRGRGALPCASSGQDARSRIAARQHRPQPRMRWVGRRARWLLSAVGWRLDGALQDVGRRVHNGLHLLALPARVLHHTPESATLATALAAPTHATAVATTTVAAATHAATAHATAALSATAHASASVATTAPGCATTRRTT